jgi:hypothetical protein
MKRNRSKRNAFLERKSWRADNGHKGYWKLYVSKADRRGAKEEIRRFQQAA